MSAVQVILVPVAGAWLDRRIGKPDRAARPANQWPLRQEIPTQAARDQLAEARRIIQREPEQKQRDREERLLRELERV
jgi:hypothetical protein